MNFYWLNVFDLLQLGLFSLDEAMNKNAPNCLQKKATIGLHGFGLK
jgi:hypothetical protein